MNVLMKQFCLLVLFAFLWANVSSAEYTYTPSQLSSLKSKLNGGLSPGDVVYLSDGTYTDFQVTFKGEGTASNPITLKAKNQGKVILTGNLNLKMGGNYLVVDGLVFKDGMAASGDIIEFRSGTSAFAYNCRLTNCVMDNCNNPDEKYRTSTDYSERWVMLYGKNNRVDHCYFTNKINGGVLMMVNISNSNSRENNHVIDYNFFAHRPKFDPGNNGETVRLGDSGSSQYASKTVVENNVFYACDGEVEIISIKSCENIIRKNIFYESQGAVVCRHGNNNVIESNVFIGNDKSSCGGVRIINQGHRVYNNFFQGLKGTGNKSALCVMMGVFEKPTSSTDYVKEPLNAYHRVKDVEICHNTFVDCKNIDLGTNVTYTYSSSSSYKPDETVTGTLSPECLISSNVVYYPSQSSVLNTVSGNVSGIQYSNNIYKLKNSVSLSGFVSRDLSYILNTTVPAKGIYQLSNTDASILAPYTTTNFSYVSLDISGGARSGTKSVGAQQFEYINKSFLTPKPSECGASWYDGWQTDIDYIKDKTDFWEGSMNSIGENKDSRQHVEVTAVADGVFNVSSHSKIKEARVFDLSGRALALQNINDYSGVVTCRTLSSGIYLFLIRFEEGGIFTTKICI